MAAQSNGTATTELDVVVVGAGMAGLYMLHRLRGLGFSAVVLESADDVGGTWYWNRYPGARCDVQSIDYQYSFDPELEDEWTWSERYATQPEILRYLQHVADKHDLRRDIRFGTRVAEAVWDDAGDALVGAHRRRRRAALHVLRDGDRLPLAARRTLDIPGAERFRGEAYFTSRWPHEGVDFTGKRVGVIGTGSSGIQSIPLIARQAAQMTVFQRTPNFSMPAFNGPVRPEKAAEVAADRAGYREAAKWSRGGVPGPAPTETAAMVPPDEQQRRLEAAWQTGELFAMLSVFADQGANEESNAIVAEFIRQQDPLDREGPRDGRGAVPEGPPARHQAPVPRLRVLRDLQPAPRAARRPPQAPDLDRHRDGDRHDRRVVRVRRDRLRHRLRCDDRRDRRRRHHRSRRPHPEAEVGARPEDVPRSDGRRVPELLHRHRTGQPVGAVEHGGVDRAARRLGRRHARATCAAKASR